MNAWELNENNDYERQKMVQKDVDFHLDSLHFQKDVGRIKNAWKFVKKAFLKGNIQKNEYDFSET